MNEEQQKLLEETTKNAASILYMSFVLCELKTHIYLTCEFEGKLFKMTFEPVEK